MSSMRSTVMAASVANWIILTWERVGIGIGMGIGVGMGIGMGMGIG